MNTLVNYDKYLGSGIVMPINYSGNLNALLLSFCYEFVINK